MADRSPLERLRELEAQDRQRLRQPADLASAGGSRTGVGVAVGVLATVGLLLFKFKWVLVFLLGKLKFVLAGLHFLKLGALLKTGSTMLLMIWVYAQFYGWPFAALFVILILVHELGHGAAARWLGLKVSAPVFIPFFGAFIALKDIPRTTFQDFIIGAGGPLAGTLGGLGLVGLGLLLGEAGGMLRAVAYFTLLINLFNLFPVWSLDGDRMSRPFTFRLWLIGGIGLPLLTIFVAGQGAHLNPIVLILNLIVLFRTGQAWYRQRRTARAQEPIGALDRLRDLQEAEEQPPEEDQVTPRQRIIAATTYFGLAAFLIVTLHLLWGALPQLQSVGRP